MPDAKRKESLRQLADEEFDVLIVGGGINGAVSAAALAGSGVKVGLVEKSDFAVGVSSHSSNLAWGGIKYLESFEIGLVRKLCQSRNRLTALFPSAVREIRFLTVVRKDFRWPAFMVYLGAVLYWLLGSCKTAAPRYLSKAAIRRMEPALEVSDAAAGFEYSDCHFEDNDARFVFNMVRTARDHGAVVANYTAVAGASFANDRWQVEATDELTGQSLKMHAKVLINACGPYVDEVNGSSDQTTEHRHLFSKGVHLIVDRVTNHRRVLTLFASDGRPFFVIPMGHRTCVGTTDTEVEEPDVGVSDDDRQFILDNVNAGLVIEPPLSADDIIAERCGVRPLAVRGAKPDTAAADGAEDNDWLQLSRKHALDIDAERRHISIFGGKLTDCLNVGDSIIEHVAQLGIEISEPNDYWCGEPSELERQRFQAAARDLNVDAVAAHIDGNDESVSDRLWRRYGRHAFALLELIEADPHQKEPVLSCSPIMRCELEYARNNEMVFGLDDLLRRRTRIAQLVRREVLLADPGLKALCAELFGGDADERFAEYANPTAGAASSVSPTSSPTSGNAAPLSGTKIAS